MLDGGLQVSLNFGYAFGQTGLGAILKVMQSGKRAGILGGPYSIAGTAFVSSGPEVPPSIWCIKPTARISTESDALLRQAIRAGLHCADHRKVRCLGIPIDSATVEFASFSFSLSIIIAELARFSREADQVKEVRLYISDSRHLPTVRTLLEHEVRKAYPVNA